MSLIPSLTEGLAGLGTTVCFKLLSPVTKPTGSWISGPQWNEMSMSPELRAARWRLICAATAQRTNAGAADWTRRLLEKGRCRSLYRALGCGAGVAGVPVVVGAFSRVHVMALRSYLWPGAFFSASFVVFMTG